MTPVVETSLHYGAGFMATSTHFKSGIAVLVGRSNVGKSTLLNALVGSKVSITSPLPQTTRMPVQGVVGRPQGQIVIVDTPGFFRGAKDLLTSRLNEYIRKSLEGIDVLLYIVDPTRAIGEEERHLLGMVRHAEIPKIFVLNKSDMTGAPYREDYRELGRDFQELLEVSAFRGLHLEALVEACFKYLPEGAPLYERDEKTNVSKEHWTEEVIREKLYYHLYKEVPYTATVQLDEIAERENGMMYIRARVLTVHPRYRKMIIGAGAARIKEIGTAARKELSLALNRPVYLDLKVEVDPHWQERS